MESTQFYFVVELPIAISVKFSHYCISLGVVKKVSLQKDLYQSLHINIKRDLKLNIINLKG